MLSLDDYLMGRDADYNLTDEQRQNALNLIEKLRDLDNEWFNFSGERLVITSGYRSPKITDETPGAHHDDAHEKCMGADLRDRNLELSDFLLTHLDILERLGLWMEAPKSAKNHVHLQSYAPPSGRRVFIA